MSISKTVASAFKKVKGKADDAIKLGKEAFDNSEKISDGAKEFVGKSTDKITSQAEKIKKGKEWAKDTFFNYSEEANKPNVFLPGSNYTLKKRYAVGVPLGLAATSMSFKGRAEIERLEERAKIGEMQGERMANTIGDFSSPSMQQIYDIQNEEQLQTFEDNMGKSKALKDASATGDLVFALHNLRNNG